ncbi:MAG: UPF0175 family protein [Caldilineaceae bacterium]
MAAPDITPVEPWDQQLVLKAFQTYPELAARVLQQILAHEPELRWSLVINLYLDGEISIGKAAELLEMTAFDLRDRFNDLGIPIRSGPADENDAVAEVEAARRWFGDATNGQ